MFATSFPHTGDYFHAVGRKSSDQRRRLEAKQNSGCRHSAFSRWSGSLVSVYDANEAGIDADSRWVCVCEDHDSILEVETLADAKRTANTPDWCECCYHEADRVSKYLDEWERIHGRPSRRTSN